jgi:hypothetical protein
MNKGRSLILVLRRTPAQHPAPDIGGEVPPAPAEPTDMPDIRHNVNRGHYAHPWPDALPGLGPRTIGPFDCCSGCERWSWVRYGGVVFCLPCANAVRP